MNHNQVEGGRPRVLILVRYYLPGFKAGGPLRSISNLLAALKNEFDFDIVTSDRDLGDDVPFPLVAIDRWNAVDGGRVLYLSPGIPRWIKIARLVNTGQYDLIYANSYFDREFGILPACLHRYARNRAPNFLLAPRGEFSAGALIIKRKRKLLYIKVAGLLGIYQNIYWHASTDYEKSDVMKIYRETRRLKVAPQIYGERVMVASDLAAKGCARETVGRKMPGFARVAFLSRICKKKNLDGALTILREVKANIEFNIYGPIEDAMYWEECVRQMNRLPKNVSATYRGSIVHSEVGRMFQRHHLFFFPTHGENFGHVIAESLAAGCPVLLSDQTPWRSLVKAGVGWDYPLSEASRFILALEECAGWSQEAFDMYARRAEGFRQFGVAGAEAEETNRSMFRLLARKIGHVRNSE
jgi:glycosyltransferase involved in cell wall biosynthesis